MSRPIRHVEGTGSCPSCGDCRHWTDFEAPDFDTATQWFPLLHCERCGLVRTAPDLTLAELERYYSGAYYGTPERKFLPLAEHCLEYATRLRARRLARRLGTHDPTATRILDIGCGRALLLKCFARAGYRCFGTEIAAFQGHRHAGVHIWVGGIEALNTQNAAFDLVSICHVLEHMENPRAALEVCARIVKPGGVLAVDVPNFSSWQSSLFRKFWFHLDVPRHRFHFTRPSLERMLAECGFETTAVSTSSWIQNPFGCLQSGLNAVFGNRPPNLLFQLIKQRRAFQEPVSAVRIAAELLVAVVLAPAALVENTIATLSGRGAMLSVTASRR